MSITNADTMQSMQANLRVAFQESNFNANTGGPIIEARLKQAFQGVQQQDEYSFPICPHKSVVQLSREDIDAILHSDDML